MSDQSPPPPESVPLEQQQQQPPGPPAAGFPAYDSNAQVPSTTKTLAVWALVLSFIPGCLFQVAAIVMAIITLNRSRDGRDHGKGLAIAALVIAPILLLTYGVLTIYAVDAVVEESTSSESDSNAVGDGSDVPESEAPPTADDVPEGSDVSVFDMKVGDCIAEISDEEDVLTVPLVPCKDSHVAEVYAEFELAAGTFPGDDEVGRLADGGCIKRFETFVGMAYNDSELDFIDYIPLAETWSEDRVVTCMVGLSEDETVKGTLKNSRR